MKAVKRVTIEKKIEAEIATQKIKRESVDTNHHPHKEATLQ